MGPLLLGAKFPPLFYNRLCRRAVNETTISKVEALSAAMPEAPIFHKAASVLVRVRAPHVVVREGVSAVARQATTFASLICTFCVFRPPPVLLRRGRRLLLHFPRYVGRTDRPTTETEKAHLFFAVPD